jgi:hypothetical protein
MKRIFIVKHQIRQTPAVKPAKGANTGIKRGGSCLHQTNCRFV